MLGRLLAGVAAASLSPPPRRAQWCRVGTCWSTRAPRRARARRTPRAAPAAGWTVESTFTAVQYGAPRFLTAADSTALGGGVNFFAGGPGGATSAATQVVDVSGAAAEIDAGKVAATLSALLGGYLGQTDHAAVTATFLNAAGAPGGRGRPARPSRRPTATPTALIARTASGALPAGTRQISVRIDAIRDEGSYNDAYIDNVSLVLGSGAGAPVFHKTVVVKAISGKVRVRRPGSNEFVDLTGSDGIPLGSTVDTLAGVVELTSVPKAGGKPQAAPVLRGRLQGHAARLGHEPRADRAAGLVSRRRPQRRGDQEEAAPPLGRRQGLVPHVGQVQLGHGPGHEVARQGQLRRDPDPRRARLGHGPRQGAREDRGGPGGQELPGQARRCVRRARA